MKALDEFADILKAPDTLPPPPPPPTMEITLGEALAMGDKFSKTTYNLVYCKLFGETFSVLNFKSGMAEVLRRVFEKNKDRSAQVIENLTRRYPSHFSKTRHFSGRTYLTENAIETIVPNALCLNTNTSSSKKMSDIKAVFDEFGLSEDELIFGISPRG